jgi:NAD(P)-dependent dehydrogenase (short-subunit alcohol dehydrogenase family)
MVSLPYFIYNQLFNHPPTPTTPFTNQTVIITGSNVGLGLEAARHIVSLNAQKVILAVRNLSAGDEARKSIESTTGRTGVIEVWELDLASYTSVLAFSKRANTLPRLDAVIENAALATENYQLAEGHERTITVNVISTVLLGLLLLPKLRETGKLSPGLKPRLSVVVSEVHAWTQFPEWREENTFAALSNRETARMGERYPTSKLLDILAVREMVARLRDDSVVVNMVNPGFCHSQLGRDAGLGFKVMKMFLARSTEEGSRTLVAGVAAGEESHGQYMDSGKVASDFLSGFVCSEDGGRAQRKVWGELMEILEEVQPGVSKNF